MSGHIGGWRTTPSFYRAVIGGGWFALAAVLFGRPDALVLAVPFLVFAVAGALFRPTAAPVVTIDLPDIRAIEGQSIEIVTSVQPAARMNHVSVGVRRDFWFECAPETGIVSASISSAGTPVDLPISLTPIRWGIREVAAVYVMAADAWGSFLLQQHHPLAAKIMVLPRTGTPLSSVPALAASGLIGANRAHKPGQGSEFAGIRAFRPGDRMKDIHWPASLRNRELQVVSHWAEQEGQVILVLDAASDLGVSGGIHGAASSLDITVRAACAIAEFYLHRGDRVGVRIVGQGPFNNTVRIGSGKAHFRRIADRLARIETTLNRRGRTDDRAHGIPSGSLVLMLSAMASTGALRQAATYQRRGAQVVVIDTLPSIGLGQGTDRGHDLHWRVRALERAREIRQVEHEGIPIVTWAGPATLGTLERVIGHLQSSSRLVRR